MPLNTLERSQKELNIDLVEQIELSKKHPKKTFNVHIQFENLVDKIVQTVSEIVQRLSRHQNTNRIKCMSQRRIKTQTHVQTAWIQRFYYVFVR